MMGHRRKSLLIGLSVLVWLGGTALVAFVVARSANDETSSPLASEPISTIALSQRETVALETRTIRPVISANGRVVRLDQGLVLEAVISSADLAYRLLDPPAAIKALIDGGPSGFDCAWAGIAPSTGDPAAMAMRCFVPADVRVVEGLTGAMVVAVTEPVDVPSLPLSAVLGQQDRGQVVVVTTDGQAVIRDVGLGVSDNFAIQITSGLQPDELVLLAPVQADLVSDL